MGDKKNKTLQQIKEERSYWLYDGLSLLSAIVTIVTAIVAMIKAFIEVNKFEEDNYILSIIYQSGQS